MFALIFFYAGNLNGLIYAIRNYTEPAMNDFLTNRCGKPPFESI